MRFGTRLCDGASPTMTMKSATTTEEMTMDVSRESTNTATTISGAATTLHARMNHSIHRWSPLRRTSQSLTMPPVTMPTPPKTPPISAIFRPALFVVM